MRSESFAAPEPRRDAECVAAGKFSCKQVVMEFRELGNFGIQVVLFGVQLPDVRRTSASEVGGSAARMELEEPAEGDTEVRKPVVECGPVAL